MSSLKRAKWIEGITKSKRILRDLAEIATSAIRDEDGEITDENWTLIYPRPFVETPVVRGTLIKDPANPTKYTPAAMHTEQVTLTGTTGVVLKSTGAIADSIVVKSTDGTKTFVKTTDYTYDAGANTLVRSASSTITTGQTVNVTYGTKFFKILGSVPVLVEKKLVLDDPDREIAAASFSITDYINGKIKLNIDPPADALSFVFSYTERRGTYDYLDQTKVTLEVDTLDPTGRTFTIPGAHGEVMQAEDYRTIGSAISGTVATGEAAYTLDPTAKSVKFAVAPTLRGTDKLLLNVDIYNDSTYVASTRWTRMELVKDTTAVGADLNKVYKINGIFQKFNEGKTHSVELYTKNAAPKLYKHLDANNAGYETFAKTAYAVNNDTTVVTFGVEQTEQLFMTFTARGEDDQNAGLGKITNRIVLKTVTTPENVLVPVIGDDYGAKDTSTELAMYLEIQKPTRLINPETGLERYTTLLGNQVQTQENNHFIQTRMFDAWDDSTQSVVSAAYNTDGSVSRAGAYVSDWTKYAWLKDWKESLVDELDNDPGSSDINDGLILHEIETTGISDEFPIQFWISTNNNRLAMVLMGDPTLDQDNFLTSFAYIGRIHPFYDSKHIVKLDDEGQIVNGPDGKPVIVEERTFFENDVSGNFALTTGSSTIPAAIGVPPKGQPTVQRVEVLTEGGTAVAGEMFDFSVYSYIVTYLTDGGESKPSKLDTGRVVVSKGQIVSSATTPQKGLTLKISFTLPDEATGYKIYRYHETAVSTFNASDVLNVPLYKLVTTVEKLDNTRVLTYDDDGIALPMVSAGVTLPNTKAAAYAKYDSAVSTARSFQSVIRDKYTGAILSVKFTDKWGVETATGVNDVMMFQTRSGLKFQRHQVSFITSEQFMRKEKSGQSRYTGKFHLSPVYVEHSYDKQRGWFDGVMAVDDSGIEHLDELIVDKDQPTEEVYKFFRVNAPFSFLNNSPNHAYGLAIIKSSQKWE